MSTDANIHKTAVVDDGAEIGDGTKVWHFSHVMSEAKIGKNCTLGQNVFVDNQVVIGDNVKIQNNVSVFEGVELDDEVFCGPSMVFTNVSQPRSGHPTDPSDYEKTPVGQGATLGANSTIVCGNKIGKWSFIGAGAVVTESITDHGVYLGNPARHQGWACKCGEIKLEIKLDEWICPECGEHYKNKNGKLISISSG